MLPTPLLRVEWRDNAIVPRYLHPGDVPWVRRMLDELAASVGLARPEVEARLSRRHYHEPELARLGMQRVLFAATRFEVAARAPPPEVRAAVFAEAAQAAPGTARDAILAKAGGSLGLTAADADAALYADLPEARVLVQAPALAAHDAVVAYNRALLQGLLLCAEEVRIGAAAQLRAVVRYAKLQRLLCHVERAPDGATEIALSGPLTVLRRTRKYGLAMARFVPALCGVPGWRLRATCLFRARRGILEASAADPIAGGHRAPAPFDSAVEERLYRDLLRLRPDWRVEREPEPLPAGARLTFPDFGITLPNGARILVEVVGFWTSDYLRRKVEAARAARRPDLILCVDEGLAIEDSAVPPCAVLRYRRRIDARALCALVERVARAPPNRRGA